MLTTVANLRNTTEFRVANDYTYPQLLHIGETYIKDRMLVVKQVAKAFGGTSKDQPKTAPLKPGEKPMKTHKAKGTDRRGLYPWYTPPYRIGRGGRVQRTTHKVVSLDAPMPVLEASGCVGKGKINRKSMKRTKAGRDKKVDRRFRERKRRK